jgi:ATP-dependent Clp protease ATP-binding subunit ClpC
VFERFTGRSRKVIDLATAEATRRGVEVVDSVDVLIGLIREGDGIAGHVLRADSITIELVLGARDSVSAGSDITLADVESQALKEATWLRHNYVGTEHLLLTLCCLKEGKAVQLLTHLNKRPVQLCSFVLEILGHHEEWERWLLDHRHLVGCCDLPLRSICFLDHLEN